MATTATQTQSWISRLGGSFKNVIFGIILFVVAFPVLFNNEGRAVRRAKVLDEGKGAVVSLHSANTIDPANEGKLVHLTGKAITLDTLTDADFGVAVRNKIRLARKVSMFQWHESASTSTREKLGGAQETTTTYTYSKEWADYPISSDAFRDDKYGNPPFPSTRSSDQQAADVTLGSYSLTPEIVSNIRDDKPLAVAQDDVNDRFAKFVVGGIVYIPANPEKLAQTLSDSGKDNVATAANAVASNSGVTNAVAEIGAVTNIVAQATIENLANPLLTITPDVGDIKVEFSATDECDISIISVQKSNSFAPYVSNKGQIQLVSMGIRTADEMFAAAEMPLPETSARVPRRLQCLRHGDDLERQVLRAVDRYLELCIGPLMPRNEIRDAHVRRILPRHDARPRGRTHWTRRVGVGKPHTLRRERVDVGGLVKPVAVAPRVRPAHVVDENKHDVGLRSAPCQHTTRRCPRQQRGTGHLQKSTA